MNAPMVVCDHKGIRGVLLLISIACQGRGAENNKATDAEGKV